MKKILILMLAVTLLSGCTAVDNFANQVTENLPDESISISNESMLENQRYMATQEPSDAENILNTMSSDEKKTLNVFFSNFAEAHFHEYDHENLDSFADNLISFAFIHNRINGTSEEEYNMFTSPYFDSVMGIKTDVMDEIIGRYFGVKIPHNDNISKNSYGRYEGWGFLNGYVYTEAADGEFYDYCAIATSLSDLGDGTYIAEYDIFSTELDMMDKKYYAYTPNQARTDSRLTFCSTQSAIIKPSKIEGKNTWQLLKLENVCDG